MLVTEGAGVKIAILDSGIDYTNLDIDDNYRGGFDFVNYDDNPMDDYGHGTKVAGIIAAEDNNIGILGVAPEASIYGVKVLGSSGTGYTSDVISGIEWAVNNNMDIISMSLGGLSGNYAFEVAVNNAYNSGVLLIASAGNYGSTATDNVAYPAKYDSVIAVSAIDQNDNICSFSSVGPAVELTAPGYGLYTTAIGGGYKYFSGTSASAPIVSGVAALMMASDPTLANREIRQKLQLNVIDLGTPGRDYKFGFGIPIPVANTPLLNVDIITEPNSVDSGQNAQVTIHVSSAGNPVSDAHVTTSVSDGVISPVSGTTNNNGDLTILYTAPWVTSPSSITLSVDLTKNGYEDCSILDAISVIPSLPQLETTLTAASETLEPCQDTQVTVHVSSNGNPVSGANVDLTASDGSLNPVTGLTNTNGDFTVTYTAPQVTSQTNVPLTATAYNTGYNSGSGSITLTINPVNTNQAESVHPYPNSYDNTWTITEPGAGQIRLHFSRLETESRYDYVYIYDENNVQIARYDGNHNDMWAPWVDGDTVKVRLRSDRSITKFGFIVDMKETQFILPQLETTLTAASETLEPGQDTQVTVHVSSNGNPVTSANVDISATNGSLNPVIGLTNTNGDFTVTYTAPQVTSQTNVPLTATAYNTGYNSGSGSITLTINPVNTNLAESVHPYPNSYDNTWTITEPGAGQMRLHFSRLETEARYDYVYIYDRNNIEIARYHGNHNDMWTPWVDGDTIKVRLKSDWSITNFGFIIDQKETKV